MTGHIISVIIILVLLFISLASCGIGYREYELYDTENDRSLSLNRFAAKLAEYDVVVFGEFHGNSIIHKLQADLLPRYYNHTTDFAVSMEMFERDVQDILNNYLAGNIDEEEFISQSRAWSSYKFDYRDIIEFAKSKNLPVIAANVPRHYANDVSRYGLDILDSRGTYNQEYYAKEVTLTEDVYKSKFFSTMLDSPHIDSYEQDILEHRLENLYAAQSLKDDTMAESIVNFRNEHTGQKIIHFNGDFHSRERLGVITKLLKREPDLKIGVISPLHRKDFDLATRQSLRNKADFIVVIEE